MSVFKAAREYLRLQQGLVILFFFGFLFYFLDSHQGIRETAYEPGARAEDLIEEAIEGEQF